MPNGRHDELCSALHRIADGFVELLEILERGRQREGSSTITERSPIKSHLPPVLTVRETAERLRVSRNIVYEAVATKQISSVRIGRRILIPADALQRFLNGQQEGNEK